jgi:hypothetical protein
MDGNTVLWHLVLLGLGVACVVLSAWFARQAQSVSLRKDVDELTDTVNRFANAQRRESMRRVRAGIPVVAAPEDGAPPELGAHGAPIERSPAELKAALRARLLRRVG